MARTAAIPPPVLTRRAPAGSASATTRRWSLRRTHVVVGSGAAVIAVWLGVTAPSVSPVAPAPAPVPGTAVAGTAADTTVATPGPAAAPQLPAGGGGPRGGRGRDR